MKQLYVHTYKAKTTYMQKTTTYRRTQIRQDDTHTQKSHKDGHKEHI